MARIKFMNTEVDNLTMDEVLTEIDNLIQANQNAYVVTPNVDHIVQLENGGELCDVYNEANLILTDGKPLLWIARLYGFTIKEKISGSDLFPRICEMAARKKYKMYFLGAAEGVAKKAAANLTKRFIGLNVVGTYSPPIGFERDKNEIDFIEEDIKRCKPDILIVGLGCPKQELFIYNYRERLEVPISLGLGASIDFEAGVVKRAPKWISDNGLEWLYRAIQDPGRLVKRYWTDFIKIIPIIFKYKPK